jgi:hypothetical protein
MDSWNVADRLLSAMLKAWLGSLLVQRPFLINLYTNVMTPPLSEEFGDYIQPTQEQWNGYAGIYLQVPDWTDPQVTDDVATTTQPEPALWTLPTGAADIAIAGYVVCDCYYNYLWSYQFSTPLELTAPANAQLVVSLNVGVMPYTDPPSFALRRNTVDEDSDAEEDE